MERPATDEARFADLWQLDRTVVFLNHGSFGACPRHVIDAQERLRLRLEAEPVRFMVREVERLLDESRRVLGEFLEADPNDLAFVTNATMGVNTVLRSLPFAPGDELLVTDQEYNACANALRFTAERTGARVVVVPVPFPLRSSEEVVQALLSKVTPKTRFLLIDHVTSQTGLVLPIERILRLMEARGIEVMVDGAHAPGMVPIHLDELRPAFYTGNCHKWICAPKGAAFLYVRRDRQDEIMPLSISHGYNSNRSDRSRFRLMFDWTGTFDPTAWICVGEAIRHLGQVLDGGWPAVMERNRALALEARSLLCRRFEVEEPSPAEMMGSLATVPLPDAPPYERALEGPLAEVDRLYDALFAGHRIEVPIINWPAPPKRMVRVSAQLYNTLPQYERLAAALGTLILEGV